jgi:Lysozyme like domain/LysM domain
MLASCSAVTGAIAAAAAVLAAPLSAHAAPAVPRAPVRPVLDDAHVRYHAPARPAADRLYAVRRGDTLSGIAGRFCGSPADYPALAAANGIRDADLIFAGSLIRIACQAAVQAITGRAPSRAALDSAPAARVTSLSGFLSCSGLEALWESAGGSPAEAFMAAEIAEAESGGNQWAHSPTDDIGYWQINVAAHGSMATYDPYGNARAAVEISSGGANWQPWTTYQTGAYRGRC